MNTVQIYSQDKVMEYGMETYAIVVMNCGKRQFPDKTELPNQDKIRTIGEKRSSTYLWILEADTIKQKHMKEK